VNSPVTWQGNPYMPVILCAKDDNGPGDVITGSSGNPGTAYYANPALYFNGANAGTNLILHDLRVLNAKTAITINGSTNHILSNVQMINCGNGVAATNTSYSLWNGLMYKVMTNFTGNNAVGDVEQLTVDTASLLTTNQTLSLTNCLLVAVTNKGTFTSNSVYTASSGSGVFQTVGGGSHYLPTNSSYLGVGTTNIAPSLAAALPQLTTYAPIMLSGNFTANTTLSPIVPRNTGIPPIGYSYYPMDYVSHNVTVNSGVTLTLTNGVALGFLDVTGITVDGSLVSQGTPIAMNHLMSIMAVQETFLTSELYFLLIGQNGSWQNLYFRFTDLPNPGGGQAAQLWEDDRYGFMTAGPITLRDSTMRAGRIWMNLGNYAGTPSQMLNMTNNVIDRGNVWYQRGVGRQPANLVVNNYNNLYHYGLLNVVFNMTSTEKAPPSSPCPLPWAFFDNLFQSSSFSETGADSLGGNVWPTLLANGHNGYVNQSSLLSSSGRDVTPAVADYQTGPLGSFYYPTGGGNLSTLIYAGDQLAANLGLDSETVMTNNVPEGTNIVSIGFHHASVGTVNLYTNCIVNPGGALSISSGAFCVGEPAFDTAYWTDIPGQLSEVYLGSGGIPVWVPNVPVYSTILTNWNVVDWNGILTTNAGSGLFFTPTNTGVGTNVFYYTYSNSPPCSPGPYTISISNTFVVVGVASLAPTNTGTWIEITNSTPGTRTFLVQANPNNGQNTLAVYATPTPNVAPANLPSCWSLNGAWTNVIFLNIATPGVYEVNCVCGTSSLSDYFVVTTNAVTTNSTVDAPCGTGPWQLGYWSFNVPSILLDYWGGESNALDTLGIYTNNGTLHGNVTYTNGVLSNAFYFDGNSSYISFGPNAGNFGTNNFTVDFWMETTATSQQGILDKRPYCSAASMWDIRLDANGTLSVEICQDGWGTDYTGFASHGRVNDGSFHHVTLNRWGTNILLYIDGVLDAKVSSTGIANIQNSTSFTAGSSACIGCDGTGYFVGILDELALWQDDLNPWFSSRNWPPLQYYNVQNPVTPWTNGLLVDSPNAAKLAYNYIEADGTANLNGSEGAVQFWFNPDWNGGTGTGAPGYWFELGDVYSPGGGWALETDPAGTGLSFVSGSNGFLMTYLTAPIAGWASNTWHQIVLSYSSSATLLFIDGALAANGPGLFFEPDLATRLADGFTVGGDHNGSGEAGGVFDELATFNCPLNQAQVTSNYPYPAILAQPAGQTVAAADTVFFSVAAESPSGLSYQWQLNGVNLAGSARIGGVTGSRLSVADVSDADAGSYTVVVGNALMSVTSAVAVLTLNDAARLGQWYFTTTNWLGQQGQSPVVATNLALRQGWSTNALWLDTNVPARLVYRDLETNVSTNFYPANIDFHTGSVIWWFKPDWNSTNGPTNAARLIDVASTNSSSTNEWWVAVGVGGTNLTFNTSSNGVATVQETGTIGWASNTWHQVVLTYDSNYSSLYVDGNWAATGGGVTNWPGRLAATNQGFAVGSDLSGNSQMRGVLADLETYNYELGIGDIEASFNAIEPGGAVYSAGFASKYSSNEFVMASIGGWPSASMMILVNSTNTNSGTWIPFNAWPTVDLGTGGDGLRTVNFYFQGLGGLTSRVTKRIWLDTTPPVLTITAPGSNTLNQPVLQLQGYANEDLYSISYDLNNANGSVSNQNVLVLNRGFDTNQWRLRTNSFQAFDIGLTPGNNTITLHAMDWAGNMTNVTTNYVLDYSNKTNAPVVTLYWPTNGSQIGGTSFTCRGSVDDPTVTLSAQITDASGDTNVVSGIVERNGNFWVENLPLAAGANTLTLTATDANNNVTNITSTVVQSSVILTIAPASDITCQTAVDVSGTINSTGYSVWVNGLETTALNPCGDGVWSWTVQNVPVNGTGTAVFQAEAIATGGSCTGGGGGTNSSLQNPGNPFSAQCACVTEFCPDKQPVIVCTAYHQQSTTVCDCPVGVPYGVNFNYTWGEDWRRGIGGDQFSTSWIVQNNGQIPTDDNGYYYGGFNWWSAQLDATGNGTESNGWSWVDNNYTQNITTGSWLDGAYVGSYTYGEAAEYEGSSSVSFSPPPGYDDGDVSDYYMQSLGYMPGGKGVPVQYVVQFTCNASNAPSADWVHPAYYYAGRANQSWTSIPYPHITMAGGRLGADGYYYKVVPSGSEPIDITPSFDGGPGANNTNVAYAAATAAANIPVYYNNSYEQFTVGQNTYKAYIQANNHPLPALPTITDPPPAFCVGQFVAFSVAFAPIASAPALDTGSYIILSNQWNFQGIFYNSSNALNFPQCSVSYYVDSNLLRAPNITNWWVSGGDPANQNANIPSQYQANSTETIKFTNGNICILSNIIGSFNMYRPVATITPLLGTAHVVGYADGTGAIYCGDPNGVQGITFSNFISYPSNFLGNDIQWVQVVTSARGVRQHIASGLTYYFVQNALSGPPFLDVAPNAPPFYPYLAVNKYGYAYDNPIMPLEQAWQSASVSNESFLMTMMYAPSSVLSMHVPLVAIPWYWYGYAYNDTNKWGWTVRNPGAKIIPQAVIVNPGFPVWLGLNMPLHWTTNNPSQ
jgi:hypothetical protein